MTMLPHTEGNCVRLDQLSPGATGIVRSVGGEAHIARRLMELGLVVGTVIEFVRRAPLGDPFEFIVRGTHLTIRRSEAEQVHVEPL